jgi:glycosyltransferase involved in cell wall biosynthesis
MRLNWLSPLPPDPPEFSDYIRHVLPELARQAEVTVWSIRDVWDPQLEQLARVRHVAGDFWSELNQADMSVFHLGDNAEYYGAIWDISRQQPGVVVLHDLSLPELFAKVYVEYGRDAEGYLQILERFYGDEGRRAAQEWVAGRRRVEDMARFPLTEYATERALAVVTHSREGMSRLRGHGRGKVFRAELPYAARRHVGTEPSISGQGDSLRLIEFGPPWVNRRLEPLLEVLSGVRSRDRFRLDVYGELRQRDSLKRYCATRGLESRVRFHGSVPEEELDRALERTDLVVNLRYPTRGEASLDQLRIWEHALPSLVFRAGWYAELDEAAVWFVRPEQEVDDIQRALSAWDENPHGFVKMGRNGRRILAEDHSPALYVQRLVGIAAEAIGFQAPAAVTELAERAESELKSWPHAEARELTAKSVARALEELLGKPG